MFQSIDELLEKAKKVLRGMVGKGRSELLRPKGHLRGFEKKYKK